MKKTIFFSFMLCVLISFAVSAQDFGERGTKGVLLNWDYWCDDMFLWCSSFSKTVYESHGYVYGCGNDTDTVCGSVKVAGGYAYFGVLVHFIGWDNVGEYVVMVPINLSTWTGLGDIFVFGESGGVLTGIAYSGESASLSFGPDPGSSRSPVDSSLTEK
jgi:hypothetical protein